MAFMLQLSDPEVKQIKLGHGVPKKYLKQREQRAREEKESRESKVQHVPTMDTPQ